MVTALHSYSFKETHNHSYASSDCSLENFLKNMDDQKEENKNGSLSHHLENNIKILVYIFAYVCV